MSPEQILALAPDASSAAAGKGLANARKWSNLGANERAIWGECQGSGSKPYQAQIDPSEPAFKCSCPSRKFPCKHGLGLYLLFASQNELFQAGTAPDWVEKWLESRQERAQKSAQKADEKAAKEADPEVAAASAVATAKRTVSRETKVEGGLKELELWLSDLMRGGLANAPAQPYSFWDKMGARLVDAQCPGLARRVRELAGVVGLGRGWQSELLASLAAIHLIIEGWKRRDGLSTEMVDELRAQIGWTIKDEELKDASAVDEEWWVLGQRSEEEEQIRLIKTWLWNAQSQRPAVFLQFGHVSQPLTPQFVPFTRLRARAVFYPGATPLRAAFREKSAVTPLTVSDFPFATSIAGAGETYSQMLSHNPWLESLPVALRGVVLLKTETNWLVRDQEGDEWPVSPLFKNPWDLLADSGGATITLFGEWNGRTLRPFHWVTADTRSDGNGQGGHQ